MSHWASCLQQLPWFFENSTGIQAYKFTMQLHSSQLASGHSPAAAALQPVTSSTAAAVAATRVGQCCSYVSQTLRQLCAAAAAIGKPLRALQYGRSFSTVATRYTLLSACLVCSALWRMKETIHSIFINKWLSQPYNPGRQGLSFFYCWLNLSGDFRLFATGTRIELKNTIGHGLN